jgi:hypothetical protein
LATAGRSSVAVVVFLRLRGTGRDTLKITGRDRAELGGVTRVQGR